MTEHVPDPELPHQVLAACLEVHGHLGPGLLREAYEECLTIELREKELRFQRGESLRFLYRGKQIEAAARLDLVVEGLLLVQVMSVPEVTPADVARMQTLLRLSGHYQGLLVNFNEPVFRKGVHRVTLKKR
jgi:GxxExxY protein